MARLTDPDTLTRYCKALADWNLAGAIEFEERGHEGLRTTLEGITVKYFKEALYRYICLENGEIDQVKELREPWREQWEWHFDLRPTINGVTIFVETGLFPESSTSKREPEIRVVQIKPV